MVTKAVALEIVLTILRLWTVSSYYLPAAVTGWGKAMALKCSLG